MTTAIILGAPVYDALENLPGRAQLLKALSKHVPVVVLDGRDRRTASPVITRSNDNLIVVQGAYAIRTSRLGRHLLPLSGAIDAVRRHHALRSIGVRRYVYWLPVADRALVRGVPARSLVFDCLDPNFLPEKQAAFDVALRQIATAAALTVSTAKSLHRQMTQYNPRSYLLPNATSAGFHPDRTCHLPRPSALEGHSGRVVGYLGTVDWRFDSHFVTTAALSLPEHTFAIVGRVNSDQETQVATLRSLPNVIMPGQVDDETGRAWVSTFDIGLVPFRMGPTNDAVNPVKMYMYLMAGLPVIATDIAECRDNPFVQTANGPSDFTTLIRAAAHRTPAPDHRARMAYALDNTWDVRANQALELLTTHRLL